MKIGYQSYQFDLKLNKPVFFHNYPTFLFRSVIGNQLRRMCCVLKTKKCPDCEINRSCVYARLFENFISKDNTFLAGRNKASHPFILRTDVCNQTQTDVIKLDLILIGFAVEYFPYFYHAIQRAGEWGILKDRIKYQVTSVKSGDRELMIDQQTVKTDSDILFWELDVETRGFDNYRLSIDFMTPYRLKIKGKYASRFEYSDLLKSVLRRADILSHLYGKNGTDISNIDITGFTKPMKSRTRWVDQIHYSARQGEKLTYGGVIGNAEIVGEFSVFERSLLRAGELFNIGKNISFGLGKIKVVEERG